MKFNSIVAIIILNAVAVHANAFSSIKIAFTQGLPNKLIIESKVSTGKCSVPADVINCKVHSSSTAFKANVPGGLDAIEEELELFSMSYKDTLVDNAWDKPNNYMKFSISGQPNVCYVDLLKNKQDILVSLNSDGSCSF